MDVTVGFSMSERSRNNLGRSSNCTSAQKIRGFKSDQVHHCRFSVNDKGADRHLRRFSVNDMGADQHLRRLQKDDKLGSSGSCWV
jgi:hypothetical protein